MPGGFYIDRQRAILNAPDILLNRTDVPPRKQPAFEEGGRDSRSQEDAKVRNTTAECIEHRHNLCGMTKSVS